MSRPELLPQAHWKVLVVDDVSAMRSLMRALLREFGITEVKQASDGGEALLHLAHARFDLVISDLSMAPINGLEMLRKLRQPGGLNAFVPVLMVSGHNDAHNVAMALAAGVTDFLTKPLTASALAQRLQAIAVRNVRMVRAPQYWGPDRRRRNVAVNVDRRQSDAVQIEL